MKVRSGSEVDWDVVCERKYSVPSTSSIQASISPWLGAWENRTTREVSSDPVRRMLSTE